MKDKHRSARGNIKPSLKKTRDFALTLWEEPTYDELQMKYFITGEEICPETQRLHWQTYVYFYNPKTWDQVVQYFTKKKHPSVRHCGGDPKENRAYCSKDENFKEYGECPSQGKRTDLLCVAESIKNGKSVVEITKEDPMLYHQYGRTLNFLEDIYMRELRRTEMTRGYWLYGKTGSGKSHRAFEGYDPKTHYLLINDNGWWDGYAQQHTVIINDFRGWIPYDILLDLIDKWPTTVRRRGREPLPFTSKRIIITSSLTPEEVYHNRHDSDSIEQLERRVLSIKCTDKMDWLVLPPEITNVRTFN